MGNINHWNNVIRDVVETLGLNENECVEGNGAIIIARQGGEEELEIVEDVSAILMGHNDVRFKFKNCIFKKPIILEQITFREILYFINSTFEEEVNFSYSLFEKRVFFSESTFK